MTDVFVEVSDAGGPDDTPVVVCDQTTARCLVLHRVAWIESYIALDGRHVMTRFEAPDAASVRLALRNLGARVDAIWAGTTDGSPATDANVVIERHFPEAVSTARLRTFDERLRAAHPDARRLRRILSRDRTRAVWLYRARAAEAIVAAQGTVVHPSHRIWACRQVAGGPGAVCDAVPKLHRAYTS